MEISDPKQALVLCAHWSQFTQKGVSFAAGREAVHMGKVAVMAETGLTTGGEFPGDLEAVDSAIPGCSAEAQCRMLYNLGGKSTGVHEQMCLHVYAQTCVGDGYGILAWSKVCFHFVDPYVDVLILFSGI